MKLVKLSFRDKSQRLLNSKILFFIVALICLALSISFGAVGYLLGIFVVIITLWANRWSFALLDLKKVNIPKALGKAVLFSIALFIVLDILIQPIVEMFLGQIDLSGLDGIRGDFTSYLVFILVMWTMAAFGEEFFYRGYLMKRSAQIFGDKRRSWFLAAFLNAIYFGLAHLYQGGAGMLTTGIAGFIFGLIYMKEKNILIPILIHGIYDMIGITLIYLDKERVILDWISSI